ncbi:hypothetical protein NMG60_11023318 [Bertholletia excelsa]
MKASIKFREDQKPVLRAKVPLSVLGFPFQSGIVAGETKELCLNFSTLSESGPILKLSYRPNDSSRPFSFGVRTGIEYFGSPIGAPMTMSAEFCFLGNGSPSFFLHFRSRIGDFSIKRTVDSQSALQAESSICTPKLKAKDKDVDSETDVFFENNETPVLSAGSKRRLDAMLSDKRIAVFPQAASAVERVFSGAEMCARTALPVKDRAVVKLRWAVRFPSDTEEDQMAKISFRKIPHLVLSKIGVEHVSNRGQELKLNQTADAARLAETSVDMVRRELDVLRAESGLLRKDVEELWLEISAGKSIPATGVRDTGKNGEPTR